jgi:transposase
VVPQSGQAAVRSAALAVITMASPSCIVLSTTQPPGIKDEIWTFGRIALLPSQPAEAQSRTSSELSQTPSWVPIHILTDTLGLLLTVSVHPASVQDRDGAEALLREARRSFPLLERIIADAGYQGQKMEAVVARTGVWALQIVRRCDRHRFVVLPKRWILERTLAWISRCRRLARDYERHARKAAAFVRLAMIRHMLRRLATSACSGSQTSRKGS